MSHQGHPSYCAQHPHFYFLLQAALRVIIACLFIPCDVNSNSIRNSQVSNDARVSNA